MNLSVGNCLPNISHNKLYWKKKFITALLYKYDRVVLGEHNKKNCKLVFEFKVNIKWDV